MIELLLSFEFRNDRVGNCMRFTIHGSEIPCSKGPIDNSGCSKFQGMEDFEGNEKWEKRILVSRGEEAKPAKEDALLVLKNHVPPR